jgi:REP element-mobilizing transposase RayT
MMDHPHRKSPRLIGYDYAQNGAYFVTICQQNRLHLFGSVVDGHMKLNAAGNMIVTYWHELRNKYAFATVEDFVVMPNHVHGIVIIHSDPRPEHNTPLAEVVKWFKIMTTNGYIRGVNNSGWTAFEGKLWQRSYHDHIIRNENEYLTIRNYVRENPARWLEDRFYNDSL